MNDPITEVLDTINNFLVENGYQPFVVEMGPKEYDRLIVALGEEEFKGAMARVPTPRPEDLKNLKIYQIPIKLNLYLEGMRAVSEEDYNNRFEHLKQEAWRKLKQKGYTLWLVFAYNMLTRYKTDDNRMLGFLQHKLKNLLERGWGV